MVQTKAIPERMAEEEEHKHTHSYENLWGPK
jgi:G2/mitotic-specific cyclin-B, other